MNIVLHRKFHFDEDGAIRLLTAYGEKLHPGVRNASCKYFGSQDEAALWLKEHPDDIGIGTGWPYNEHNNPQAEGKCSMDLVAEALGIAEDPVISKLLGEVRRADKTMYVNPSELPTLHKTWHRVRTPEQVLMRGTVVIPCLFDFERGNQKTDQIRMGMEELLNGALTSEQQRTKAGQHTLKIFRASERSERLLEVARLFRVWQMLYPDQMMVVRSWANQIIRDSYKSNEMFQQSYAQFRFPIRKTQTKHAGELSYCIMQSTCVDDSVVARMRGAQLIINSLPTGNIQVLTNAKANLDLSRVVGALRIRELGSRQIPIPKGGIEYLQSPENIPEDPCWHYLKPGEAALNGSITSSPNVTPTKLNPDIVLQVVKDHLLRRENREEDRFRNQPTFVAN